MSGSLYILRDLSESRRLQLYSKFVVLRNRTLTNRERRPSMRIEVTAKVRRICDGIFEDINSPYMDKDEMKAWHSKIVDGEIGAAKGLLLTLLPNVKRIVIVELGRSSSEIWDMIYKISKTNDQVSSLIWEKLSRVKLHEVTICLLEYFSRCCKFRHPRSPPFTFGTAVVTTLVVFRRSIRCLMEHFPRTSSSLRIWSGTSVGRSQ